jgi:hypothetical protein
MRSPSERISPIGAKYCSPLGSRPRGQGLRRSATSHQALAVPGRRNPRRGGVPPARAASVDAIGPVMISRAEAKFRRTAERDLTSLVTGIVCFSPARPSIFSAQGPAGGLPAARPTRRNRPSQACWFVAIPMPRRRRARASKRSPRRLGRRDRARGKGVVRRQRARRSLRCSRHQQGRARRSGSRFRDRAS